MTTAALSTCDPLVNQHPWGLDSVTSRCDGASNLGGACRLSVALLRSGVGNFRTERDVYENQESGCTFCRPGRRRSVDHASDPGTSRYDRRGGRHNYAGAGDESVAEYGRGRDGSAGGGHARRQVQFCSNPRELQRCSNLRRASTACDHRQLLYVRRRRFHPTPGSTNLQEHEDQSTARPGIKGFVLVHTPRHRDADAPERTGACEASRWTFHSRGNYGIRRGSHERSLWSDGGISAYEWHRSAFQPPAREIVNISRLARVSTRGRVYALA